MQTDQGPWRLFGEGGILRWDVHSPFLDNRSRDGRGICILQYSLEGTLVVRHAAAGEVLVPKAHAALLYHGQASVYGLHPEHLPYRSRWISLSGAGLVAVWEDLISRHGLVLGPDHQGELAVLLEGVAAARPARHADPHQACECIHRFVAALDRFADSRTASGTAVERACAMLMANPCHPWSLQQIAQEHGCTRTHFTRVFRQRTGLTPSAWLIARRLQAAELLLRETDLGIAAVAQQSGFGGVHNFDRHFRRAHACSPSRWRRSDS